MEREIETIIAEKLLELNRPDLYRQPITAFSAANDRRYAQLKEIIGDWSLNPIEIMPKAKSVISYFIPYTKKLTDEPKKHEDASYVWAEAYELINKHFHDINEAVVKYLISKGFLAESIIVTYDHDILRAVWSHKSAAAIAGLGVFGANRLLITEKGSSGRYGSIITSAKLEANENTLTDKCLYIKSGSCGLCFKICPVNALAPNSFDKFSCKNVLLKNKKILQETSQLEHVDVCGKCISICPLAYVE